MKILIAVPARDRCDAFFTQSLVNLARGNDTEVKLEIGTLVYHARNKLCGHAVATGADMMLWIDDDMVFQETLLFDLLRDMRDGVDMVAPICYMRKPPYAPVIYERLERPTADSPKVVQLYDNGYPENGPFEVAGCGFGCVLMRTAIIEPILAQCGALFDPEPQFGEDLSFCLRARDCGFHVWADPAIQLGHRGYFVSDRGVWEAYRNMKQGGNADA